MYDYTYELDAIAKRDKARLANKKPLVTKAAYNNNAYGSASCAGGSWELALDAYAEYRRNCAY